MKVRIGASEIRLPVFPKLAAFVPGIAFCPDA
jgi:hypothetical protein